MAQLVSGKVAGLTDTLSHFWDTINLKDNPFIILDVLLVALLIYWVYLFLKETRAMRIIYGIVILAIIFFLGKALQLETLNYLLKYVMTMIVVAIPVVFQPELRSALEKLGRADIVGGFGKLQRSKMITIVKEIVHSAELLSKNKIGALIVLARQTGLRDYIETGVKLDADVSTEIILTVFTPKTPLHDGALVINGDKIIAAGCTLPLAEIQYDYNLGTRHRAAIGLSMQTDALVIVVSEERGQISLGSNGILSRNLSPEKLEELLLKLLRSKSDRSTPQLKEIRK
jgi:diadenylate cyclase